MTGGGDQEEGGPQELELDEQPDREEADPGRAEQQIGRRLKDAVEIGAGTDRGKREEEQRVADLAGTGVLEAAQRGEAEGEAEERDGNEGDGEAVENSREDKERRFDLVRVDPRSRRTSRAAIVPERSAAPSISARARGRSSGAMAARGCPVTRAPSRSSMARQSSGVMRADRRARRSGPGMEMQVWSIHLPPSRQRWAPTAPIPSIARRAGVRMGFDRWA